MTVRVDRGWLLRMLLAHHPTCGLFAQDTFRVGRWRLCVGCFTAFPVAAATLAVLTAASMPWQVALWGGALFGTVQGVSLAGRARTRRQKVAVKTALGLGLGGVLHGIAAAPWESTVRVLVLLGAAATATACMVPRMRRLLATCDGCLHRRDWERCPGMGVVPAPDRGLPA